MWKCNHAAMAHGGPKCGGGGCALSECSERPHQRKERPAPRRKPQGKCNKGTWAEAEGYSPKCLEHRQRSSTQGGTISRD